MNTNITKTARGAVVSALAVLAVGCGSAPADEGRTLSPPVQEQPVQWGGPDRFEHQPGDRAR